MLSALRSPLSALREVGVPAVHSSQPFSHVASRLPLSAAFMTGFASRSRFAWRDARGGPQPPLPFSPAAP